MNHFFRGKDHPGGGDQIFFQGHASPGMYARAYLEGRLTEDQLDGFRQEKSHIVDGAHPGAAVLPAPAADAGLLGVPDRVDGPRPHERHLPGARSTSYLDAAASRTRSRDQHVWAFLGDGEMDEPESRGAAAAGRQRGARQPHFRHQLQPAAARRTGARQRQDHPGARGVLPRRRLERHQGDLGPRAGTRCWRRPTTAPSSTS